jgi:hypothetical protein
MHQQTGKGLTALPKLTKIILDYDFWIGLLIYCDFLYKTEINLFKASSNFQLQTNWHDNFSENGSFYQKVGGGRRTTCPPRIDAHDAQCACRSPRVESDVTACITLHKVEWHMPYAESQHITCACKGGTIEALLHRDKWCQLYDVTLINSRRDIV